MELALALDEPPPPGDLLATAAFFALLLAVSAFLSMSEFALLGFSKIRRRQLVEEEHPRIGAVERLMARPQRLLIGLLFAKIAANVAAAAIAGALAVTAWGSLGLGAAVAVLALTMLALTEIVPKAYAARHAERVAMRVAPILLVFAGVLWPLGWLADRFAAKLGLGARRAERFQHEEELKTLITLGAEDGKLEEDEEELIQSVIEFGETSAKEVMVPRIDMTAVPGDAKLEHVRSFVIDSGFSRIPVYEDSMDNVVGVLYVKDLLVSLIERRGNLLVRDIMREPVFVPESMKLGLLLAEMREKRVHMAIVVDEFGGTAGVITLEDVLEEIVGEIFDEYDLRQDPIRVLDARTALVDARTHVADVNDELDIEIPEDEAYDTVAGYVHHELGRLGKEGESVQGRGFQVIVDKVVNRRILRARIVKDGGALSVGDAADEPDESPAY